jgi:uncharacterized protein (DUF3084 family)
MYIIYTPVCTAAEVGLGATPSGSCILCSRTLIPSALSSSFICDWRRCPGVDAINCAKETRLFIIIFSKLNAVDTPRERRPHLPKNDLVDGPLRVFVVRARGSKYLAANE